MARFGLRPATPGTLAVLVAFVLLLLVSLSTPIVKSIYFLKTSVNVSVDVATINLDVGGEITLGMWGYCIKQGTKDITCSNTTLGYTLDADNLFGVPADVSKYINIPDALIKGLTYALVVHPIAAALAGISLIFGICAHIRELSTSGLSICIAGTASTIALLAFIFDIITFSIAKSRLQAANVGATASLGNGIWMTLAAFVLLLSSGIFFCVGRCCIRTRPSDGEKSSSRPAQDTTYASKLRRDAESDAQRRRQDPSYSGGGGHRHNRSETGLPAFAEYGETVPLTRRDHYEEEVDMGDYSDADHNRPVQGVGMGYGQRNPQIPDPSGYVPRRQPTNQSAGPATQSRIEPFHSMYQPASSPTSPSRGAPMPFGGAAAALAGTPHGSTPSSMSGQGTGYDGMPGGSHFNMPQQAPPGAPTYPPMYDPPNAAGGYHDPYAPAFAGAAGAATLAQPRSHPTSPPASNIYGQPGGSQFFAHQGPRSPTSAYPTTVPYSSPPPQQRQNPFSPPTPSKPLPDPYAQGSSFRQGSIPPPAGAPSLPPLPPPSSNSQNQTLGSTLGHHQLEVSVGQPFMSDYPYPSSSPAPISAHPEPQHQQPTGGSVAPPYSAWDQGHHQIAPQHRQDTLDHLVHDSQGGPGPISPANDHPRGPGGHSFGGY